MLEVLQNFGVEFISMLLAPALLLPSNVAARQKSVTLNTA